jgi:hypothetical protein
MSRVWRASVCGVLALVSAACTSGQTVDRPAVPDTAGTVPPSTILDGSTPVAVPFTADLGALLVTEGPPPSDVTREEAVARFEELRRSDRPSIVSVVSGLVTLGPGLGVDPVSERPAWVIVYTATVAASCPAMIDPPPTPPPTASHLHAVIVFGDTTTPGFEPTYVGPVLGYEGAGTGPCTQRTVPMVLTENQLAIGMN